MNPFTTYDDGVVLPSDISFAAYLGGLTPADVITDRAAHLTRPEIALMTLPRGYAA
jgi:hypothetical protein